MVFSTHPGGSGHCGRVRGSLLHPWWWDRSGEALPLSCCCTQQLLAKAEGENEGTY